MRLGFSPRGIGLAVAFLVLAAALLVGTSTGLRAIGIQFHDDSPVETPLAIVGTALALALVLFATWGMARIERRDWRDFGLRDSRAGRHFGVGLGIGIGAMIGLAVSLTLLGGLAVQSHASGWRDLGYGAIWAVGFLGTALFEEILFRGYLLKRLTEATSFPIAAVATSLLFGLAHLTNGFDAGLTLLNAMLVGLLLALSIRATGSLWWAIGFHAGWDWFESYVLGAADSGIRAQGSLLQTGPAGPAWLSGGNSGPEGSVITLAIALSILVWMTWLVRKPGAPISE